MTRREIMLTVNNIITELQWCDDEEFVDRVCSAVGYADYFTEEEIEELS